MNGIISKPLGTMTINSGASATTIKFPNVALVRVSDDDGDGLRYISDTKTTALVQFFCTIVYNTAVPPGTSASNIKASVEWEAYS